MPRYYISDNIQEIHFLYEFYMRIYSVKGLYIKFEVLTLRDNGRFGFKYHRN